MEVNRIDLGNYKSGSSTIFTGRPQGTSVREKLDLDEFDNSKSSIVFIIPSDTTSFNPSFYLGLLFKSYEKLGIEGFDEKYSFEISTTDEATKKVLLSNLEDGKRYAINSITPSYSFKSLFNKKK